MATVPNFTTMFKALQTNLILITILLFALFWAISSQQPQPLTMRRESLIRPASLEDALSISLAIGDYRKVDFSEVMKQASL